MATVNAVTPLTESITGITIDLPESREFRYLPGQFAFLTIRGDISTEPHPFTIASAPTHSRSLQFLIKSTGDWTSEMTNVKVGDLIRVDGPYGLFNHLARGGADELILIAGGIGITPMLSMLRFMAGASGSPRVTLIWSLSHSEDMFLRDEFEDLQKQSPKLNLNLVYTRARHGSRRLDMDKINSLTKDCSRSALIFVCGPSAMTERAVEDCESLGFSGNNIFREKFGL